MVKRNQFVWASLVASMTGAGAVLWGLEGGSPRMDGLALPALVSAAGPTSIESVFRTRSPVPKGQWQSIVIHCSGSLAGTPATIEAQQRALNIEGLGYHFVIGNGAGTGDGEVHVGYRWMDQLPGAHTAGPKGDWFNRHAVGICLVGDGQRRPFTDQQINRLVQLTAALADKLGVPPEQVYLHSDLAPTASPGRFFPAAVFRERLAAAR